MQLFLATQYQAEARQRYEQHRVRVAALLPGAQLEHVGASAVPGALSKGDIDICVVVPGADHARCVAQLERLGHRIKAATFRSAELRMLEAEASAYPVALQVVASGSKFEFSTRFRDALIEDQTLLQRYNALKLRFADGDSPSYRAAKSAFIEAVLGGRIEE